jgi:hypothetical protein
MDVLLLLVWWSVAPELLWRSARLSRGWCMDHAILQRSTGQLIVGQVGGYDQTILQLWGEPLVEELNLLIINVNVVCPVLREVVELLAVLIDGVVPLL